VIQIWKKLNMGGAAGHDRENESRPAGFRFIGPEITRIKEF
jgi:hypothetical protein